MSVQTQIDRLASAKAAIKAAIEGKGVTVPDGTLLDGMAALIESIEAGGGGGSGEVTYGTITPADMQADTLEIEHGLGVKPMFVLICAKDNINNVYSASSPNGQSFIYAINSLNPSHPEQYCSRSQYDSSVKYHLGQVQESIGTGLNYYIAISDTSIIWAKRNKTYGFGNKQSSFFWVAMKEV